MDSGLTVFERDNYAAKLNRTHEPVSITVSFILSR